MNELPLMRIHECHESLDNLDAGVHAMVDKDTNEIPKYQESMQVATWQQLKDDFDQFINFTCKCYN
jgi:hypothetical protein